MKLRIIPPPKDLTKVDILLSGEEATALYNVLAGCQLVQNSFVSQLRDSLKDAVA